MKPKKMLVLQSMEGRFVKDEDDEQFQGCNQRQ